MPCANTPIIHKKSRRKEIINADRKGKLASMLSSTPQSQTYKVPPSPKLQDTLPEAYNPCHLSSTTPTNPPTLSISSSNSSTFLESAATSSNRLASRAASTMRRTMNRCSSRTMRRSRRSFSSISRAETTVLVSLIWLAVSWLFSREGGGGAPLRRGEGERVCWEEEEVEDCRRRRDWSWCRGEDW